MSSALRQYRVFISHAWDYSDGYRRIVTMLDSAPRFTWANHSVPRHDPLLVNNNAALERKLRDQMKFAQVVIVLAGMYVNHRYWIQTEINLANEMKKPIIGVIPWSQQRTPVEVQKAALEMVAWNTSSIVDAIRRRALNW